MSLLSYEQRHDRQYLRSILEQNDCFESKVDLYLYGFPILLILLILNVICLVFFDILFLQVMNAICLAFIFGQLGLIAHDIVHRQVWRNVSLDMIVGNLLLGISRSWWHDKHNKRHHGYTNQPGFDDDIEAPLLAFTEEQAMKKKGLERLMIRYQVYYLPFLFMLISFDMSLKSIYFLVSRKSKYRVIEIVLLVIHIAVFPVLFAISYKVFILFVISKALFGVYLGTIFVVNHTGMPILNASDKIDFVTSQVITSRNIKSHPLADFIMGGLNAQIEHHLFPQMPRPNLKQARNIVKQFCVNNNIPYHETSFLRAFQETLAYLNGISRVVSK